MTKYIPKDQRTALEQSLVDRKSEPCSQCGDVIAIHKIIDAAGRDHYPVHCIRCGHKAFVYRKEFVPMHIRQGAAWKVAKQNKADCERCGKHNYLEAHHWAPVKLFRDADEWPMSMLCRCCHAEWHATVTGDTLGTNGGRAKLSDDERQLHEQPKPSPLHIDNFLRGA